MESKNWKDRVVDWMFTKYSIVAMILVTLTFIAVIIKYLNVDV